MKNKIFIANWKMSISLTETENLTKEILAALKKIKNLGNLEIVLCPSFTALPKVGELIKKTEMPICLGAQDVFWEERGAYTGEISVLMLKELGVKYIIVGHSERRNYLKEDDEMIHKKVKVILNHGLIPILCVGEKFEERQIGQKDFVIIQQVSAALDGIHFDEKNQIVIAYEPVWVIGSGQAVEPTEAEYTHRVIKQRLIDFLPIDFIENNVRIIYGGSVEQNNVSDFLEQENVDGVLVGGASLKTDEFLSMIKKFSINH
ncbi:MAG: triose-phosphate isomerase [Patescibacteria group bacterium]|nr:triose-phosphate isomerase [Patescibacteria group bacterium]